ncbi:PaaX family transcriptional regulator C-terminal domain-containing protein [Nocardia goodfellowii]|uniref:Phenylacetic acid degradation operon negative regulatory protein n=1 Tax=Nocardia goodfellowii TaxID=882446 RepID=A0ABS4QTM5_9NOCA|nr:PaaX family transcriptional regulator C-terminal domain-containing protein [Nocardia goodfellowii]MBP2194394.1 phenylacetic acid degradation operon negative regulatory protein [Nocardia goodfellowii]
MRKLTARSAILSALLGAHPAEAPVSWIVTVAEELGLQQSAVRVALTRMVAAGDLERSNSVYRLSQRLIERQRRQDAALRPVRKDWNGQWYMAVVTAVGDEASARIAFRDTMRANKLAELREGVWTRPDNIAITLGRDATRRIAQFRAEPQSAPMKLAESLFRPKNWARDAERLLRAFESGKTMADRFEVAAAAVRHILDDPLLPEPLLPANWPGPRLRAEYEGFRTEFIAFAEQNFVP